MRTQRVERILMQRSEARGTIRFMPYLFRRALVRGATAVVVAVLSSTAVAETPVDKPFEERSLFELYMYGWSKGIGPSLLGQRYYGVGYRFELARWAMTTGPAARLSGVSFTLNRDFLINVFLAVLIESGEAGGQIRDSGGWRRVGPSSDAGAQTSRFQPFSLDVTLYDETLGSELNGAAADVYYTFVLAPQYQGGLTLTVGLNMLALGQPRNSAAYAWVSWFGAFADFRAPLGVWWLAARLRASFPFVWGRQGSLSPQAPGANLPEDRRYLARVDAMLEGYITNVFVLGAGLTWGVAQLGEGFGFRADVGVRF